MSSCADAARAGRAISGDERGERGLVKTESACCQRGEEAGGDWMMRWETGRASKRLPEASYSPMAAHCLCLDPDLDERHESL